MRSASVQFFAERAAFLAAISGAYSSLESMESFWNRPMPKILSNTLNRSIRSASFNLSALITDQSSAIALGVCRSFFRCPKNLSK
ncbi:hypothetical protein D3C71_1934510 [compost metagenome]